MPTPAFAPVRSSRNRFGDLLDEAVRLSAKRGLLDEFVELAGEEVRRIFDRLGPPNRGLVPADGGGGWLDDIAGPTANPPRANPVTPDQLRPPGAFMAMGDELDALGSKITSEAGSGSPLHRRLEDLRKRNAQIEALEEQAKNGDIDAAYEAAEKTDELAREVQRLEDEVMTAVPARVTGSITDIFRENIPRLLAKSAGDEALEWKVRKITNGGPCRPPCPVIGDPANRYYVERVDAGPSRCWANSVDAGTARAPTWISRGCTPAGAPIPLAWSRSYAPPRSAATLLPGTRRSGSSGHGGRSKWPWSASSRATGLCGSERIC